MQTIMAGQSVSIAAGAMVVTEVMGSSLSSYMVVAITILSLIFSFPLVMVVMVVMVVIAVIKNYDLKQTLLL